MIAIVPWAARRPTDAMLHEGLAMMFPLSRRAAAWGLVAAICIAAMPMAISAPRIANLSLRGLQLGAKTTLVVDGSELGPDSRVIVSAPGVSQAIKPGSTSARLEVELAVDAAVAPGIYLLRVASATGVSPAVAIGIDSLPQLPFARRRSLSTRLTPRAWRQHGAQHFVRRQEGAKRADRGREQAAGRKLNPSVHVYDARHAQLTWSQGCRPLPATHARWRICRPTASTPLNCTTRSSAAAIRVSSA